MRIKDCNISFTDQVVSIVGGGPSLKNFDFGRLKHPIVGVNDAGIRIPCDAMVALDKRVVKMYKREIDELGYPLITNGVYEGYPDNVVVATCERSIPLDLTVRQSMFSGLFAMLVALTLGARRLFLFGFDGGFSKGDTQNWYPSHTEGMLSWHYEIQNERYKAFEGHDIINVGVDSKIDAFPKVSLEEDFYSVNILLNV
jgi:hypothetical protein